MSDANTWASFDQAVRGVTRFELSGVGFVLTNTPIVGLDWDYVLCEPTLLPYVFETLRQFNNPVLEKTPSGLGLRAFFEFTGKCLTLPKKKFQGPEVVLPNGEHKNLAVEIYAPGCEVHANGNSAGRYFTVTGAIYRENGYRGSGVPKVSDAWLGYLLLTKMFDHKFVALWLGDTSGYANDDSRADAALCWLLAREVNNDPAKIEAAFSQSKLGQRSKWRDREDYRRRTIEKTISAVQHNVGRGATEEKMEQDYETWASLDLKKPRLQETDPRILTVAVCGQDVSFMDREVLDATNFRRRIFQATGRLIPRFKPLIFDELMTQLVTTAERVEAPADASRAGMIVEKVKEWLENGVQRSQEIEDLLKGLPAIYEEQWVAFRVADLQKSLQNNNFIRIDNAELYSLLRTWEGAKAKQLSICGKKIRAWLLPLANLNPQTVPFSEPRFETEERDT